MTVILGPVLSGSPATKVTEKSTGRVLYKKQILPEGTFEYNGKKLDLGAEQLKSYVQSFRDGAFDEVPFQFGGSESEHNNDPKNRGGTLAHVEHVPGKGVMGYFDFSMEPKSVEYVEKYPRFGVSPRIELGIKRADGKTFSGAIQHVCGTLVPRINGMGAWEKVELSAAANTADEVVDFSTEVFDLDAPPEIDFLNDKPVPTPPSQEGDSVAQITDEDLATLKQIREDNALIESLAGPMGTQMTADLSNGKATAPVAPVDTEARTQLRELRVDLARSKWETQAALLTGAGVPPSAIELARPIMEEPDDKEILLSSGDKTTDKVRTLALLEAMKGTVDLGGEMGHQVPALTPADEEEMKGWTEVLGMATGY